MSLDGEIIQNKMMEAAPAKKGFHFSGDGVWHNAYVVAETLEEATKEWLASRKPINPTAAAPTSTTATAPTQDQTPQSTPAVDEENKQ